MSYNFKDKKVFDFILHKLKDADGNRIFFVIFLTEQNDIFLVKHIKGEQKVYTEADIIGQFTLSNPLTHVRGYFRKIRDVEKPELGIVIIERENEGERQQHMRRYVIAWDNDFNPTISLAGVQSIGKTPIGQLEVNNKFIILSKPTQGKLMLYKVTDMV